MPRLDTSLAALIVANAVPLVGVLFLDWDAAFIISGFTTS